MLSFVLLVFLTLLFKWLTNFFVQHFRAFQDDLRLRCAIYDRMKLRADMKKLFVVTDEQWAVLQHNWTHVSQRMRLWHWKLDSALPGRLGQIGDWLYRNEESLEMDSRLTDESNISPADVRRKIEEYKVTILYLKKFF